MAKTYLQEKITEDKPLDAALVDGLADVATSGDFEDLVNKPEKLPEKVNDRYLHTNESTGNLEWVEVENGGVQDVQVDGETIVESGVANIETEEVALYNIATTISAVSTDQEITSAKAVWDVVGDITAALAAL